jgi:hypothetical protein
MTTFNCKACEGEFDTDDGSVFSNIVDAYFCYQCYGEDIDGSSKVIFVFSNGGVKQLFIGDAFRTDEYGDEYHNEKIKREYISNDAWRGHYETTIEGFTEVLGGWTTGSWGDPIADRKALFNDLSTRMVNEELNPPCVVALVFDPTSNLFSVAVSVLVPTGSEEVFKLWLEQEGHTLNDLEDSLA